MSKILHRFKKENVPLDEYIDGCLYKFSESYYESKKVFGLRGDFITAPYVSSIFGEIIALHILDFFVKRNIKNFRIIEIGAGEGLLAADIINTISKFQKFIFSYNILEKSKNLQQKQRQKLKFSNVNWVSSLNKIKGPNSFIICNELLDAFPVKQLKKINNIWHEKYVMIDKKKKKVEEKFLSKPQSIKKISDYVGLNHNFIEYAPMILPFVKQISEIIKLKNNCFLTIDYGYIDKYFHDTTQGLRKHKKTSIYKHPGETDITHLINFNFLKSLFNKNGKFNCKTTNQSTFLKENGILERLSQTKKHITKDVLKNRLDLAVDRLININQMGDLFKVLIVNK